MGQEFNFTLESWAIWLWKHFTRPQTHMKDINQNFLNMRNIHYVRQIESWVGFKVLKVRLDKTGCTLTCWKKSGQRRQDQEQQRNESRNYNTRRMCKITKDFYIFKGNYRLLGLSLASKKKKININMLKSPCS